MRFIKEVILIVILFILLVLLPFQIITSPSYTPEDITEVFN